MLKKLAEAGKLLAASPCHVLLFFSILVILLRWTSFYHSVIDWDESLYILVADKWLDGHLPYTVIWDNKPPGVYILFSIALGLLGRSVFSIRILACVAIIITCHLLYLISRTIYPIKKEIGLIAGIFYATISTTCGGMSSNTEIFFIPLSVAAFYLLTKNNYFREDRLQNYTASLLIGLLLGIAFEIKQVVVFDLLAMIFILGGVILTRPQLNRRWLIFIKTILFLLTGFILPFLLVSLYFLTVENFHNYWYAVFTANKIRVIEQTSSSNILSRLIKKAPGIYPIAVFVLFSFPLLVSLCLNRKTKPKDKIFIFSIAVWFLLDFLGINLIFQRLYTHYFLQLSPIVSLAAALAVGQNFMTIKIVDYKNRSFFPILIVIVLTSCLIISDIYSGVEEAFFHHVKGIKHWNDTPAQISEYLQPRIYKDSYIYVVDYQPIIYFLTKTKIPTRYAFPSFLISDPDLANITNITGIEPIEELERIMSKRPVYLIMRGAQQEDTLANNRSFYKELSQYLNDYRLETFIDSIDLYRLKNGVFKGSLLQEDAR